MPVLESIECSARDFKEASEVIDALLGADKEWAADRLQGLEGNVHSIVTRALLVISDIPQGEDLPRNSQELLASMIKRGGCNGDIAQEVRNIMIDLPIRDLLPPKGENVQLTRCIKAVLEETQVYNNQLELGGLGPDARIVDFLMRDEQRILVVPGIGTKGLALFKELLIRQFGVCFPLSEEERLKLLKRREISN